MVASFSPDDQSVTMISIPRDLYVNVPGEISGKINSLMAYKYGRTTDLDVAATFLSDKVSDIT